MALSGFFLEITSFYTTPIGQVILCHVTDVKNDTVYITTTLLVFVQPKFQELDLINLQSKNIGVKSIGKKISFVKNAL